MEVEILGYTLLALVTIIGFAVAISKMSKPINDLLVVVQELKDCIKQLKETNLTHNEKLERHRKEIDGLKIKVKELETKIDMYHGN
jgi:uncharacterized coiled-coil DUF342 family protein